MGGGGRRAAGLTTMTTVERVELSRQLRSGLRMQRTAPPCAMVIFGASGDLTRRKLVPALYSLMRAQRLAPTFSIIGVSNSPLDSETFRKQARSGIEEFGEAGLGDEARWNSFAGRMQYIQGSFDDPGLYKKLAEALQSFSDISTNRLFYLATPPSMFSVIVDQLGRAGLDQNRAPGGQPAGWTRIIIEKPFGRDLASARALNAEIQKVFDEQQILRIDHYLGKETVRNILVFRFGNGIFEPIWNRRYIDHVQITVAESIGIEQRGRYYEEAGALRDMIQNHLLQVLSIVAMEAPVRFESEPVRDEKTKVLRSIRPIFDDGAATPDEVAVRGQYGPGYVNGKHVPGYREEANVEPDSTRETFAALKLEIDNWRWAGVPFYLRSGKRLPKRVSEVSVRFKTPPYMMFQNAAPDPIDANVLTIRIQPDEGISLRFEAKVPGTELRLRPVNMDFHYGSSFGEPQPEAYETLLLDAMLGDNMLFSRYDMVEAAWTLTTPLLEYWEENAPRNFPNYAAGTWGPPEADELTARDGREWRRP
jgi:glucose-6-phosphate 1-dehydrogenase